MMLYLLYLLIFLILATAVFGAISAAPYLPTKKKDVPRMIELAKIKNDDIVYDLGSGDGRLIFASAKAGAEQAIGIEVFALPYLFSWIKSFFYSRTKILYGDFFNYNLSNADVVFIFLLNKSYKRLVEKFKQELKPGTRIVVGCWPIEEFKDKLIKQDGSKDEKKLPIYLYKI
jgi:ribosomal protein L11 methylase PrmA